MLSLKASFQGLDAILMQLDSNITLFHEEVYSLETQLQARGETISDMDLMLNLTKAYKSVNDQGFTTYMNRIWDELLEGMRPLTATQYKSYAENRYKILMEREEWKKPSATDCQILALQADVKLVNERANQAVMAMAAKTRTPDKVSPPGKWKDNPNRVNGMQKWKLQAPKEGEPREKRKNNNLYFWCTFHGFWTAHKPEDCKLDPKNKDGEPEESGALMAASARVEEEIDDWGA